MISKKAENHRTSWKKEKGKIYHIYRAGRGNYMTYDWQQKDEECEYMGIVITNTHTQRSVLILTFEENSLIFLHRICTIVYFTNISTQTLDFFFQKMYRKTVWINSYWLVLMISLTLKMKNGQDNALWLYEGPTIDYDPDIFIVPKIR